MAETALGVGLAATGLVVLIASSSFYAVSLKRESDLARREAEKARRTADLLAGLFQASDPFSAQRLSKLSARELLDAGAAKVEGELADQLEVRASLFHTLGTVYRGLRVMDQARHFAELAVGDRRRLLGEDAPETLNSRAEMAF